MIAAARPIHHPADARVLHVDADGRLSHHDRRDWLTLLRPGDVVIANDAATIPASLRGTHLPTGRAIEVRLAGRDSILPATIDRVSAIVFGEGDYRTPTERRTPPPVLRPGDGLALGPVTARVTEILGHSRFVTVEFEASPARIWEAIARHGRPVQYAHVPETLLMLAIYRVVASIRDRRANANEPTLMFPNLDQTTVFTPSRYLQVPDERTGILMVFRVFERVSYAIVLNSTDAIRTGDYVRTP